jgi:hypothetical protein
MVRRGRPIAQVKTVQITVEGFCDRAFAEHLKSLYCNRGCGVTVRIVNAKGKGSNHVVRQALTAREAPDIRAAFYDTDVQLQAGLRRQANGRKRIHLVESEPCLEGLLLAILGRHVPHASGECKKAVEALLEGSDPTDKDSYAELFSREVLEERRGEIAALDLLLRVIEGRV